LSSVHELLKNRLCEGHSLLKAVNEFWLHFSCILDDFGEGRYRVLNAST